MSQAEQLAHSLDFTRSIVASPSFPHFRPPSSFQIEETNSYNVTDHFARIKHGIPAELPKMFIEFPSLAEATSFKCSYELRPANLRQKAPAVARQKHPRSE